MTRVAAASTVTARVRGGTVVIMPSYDPVNQASERDEALNFP